MTVGHDVKVGVISINIINAVVARKTSNDLNIAMLCNVIGLAMVFERETAVGETSEEGENFILKY